MPFGFLISSRFLVAMANGNGKRERAQHTSNIDEMRISIVVMKWKKIN